MTPISLRGGGLSLAGAATFGLFALLGLTMILFSSDPSGWILGLVILAGGAYLAARSLMIQITFVASTLVVRSLGRTRRHDLATGDSLEADRDWMGLWWSPVLTHGSEVTRLNDFRFPGVDGKARVQAFADEVNGAIGLDIAE